MTDVRDQAFEELRRRARDLQSEGKWAELGVLLEGADRARLLEDGALAYLLGEALYHTGRMTELAEFAAEFEVAVRRTGDTPSVMRGLNLRGIAAFELGETEQAQERFDELMGLATALRDEEMLARAANNLGSIANLRGRPEEAIACYGLAIPIWQRLGRIRGLGQTRHNLGLSYRDLGRLDDAEASYLEAMRLAGRISYLPLVAMAMAGRAEILLRRGDARLAERLAERSGGLAREVGDPISEAEALRVRGLARARLPARDTGEAATAGLADLEEAAGLARRTGNVLLQAEIERDVAGLLLARDDREGARARLEAAAIAFERIGAVTEAREARARARALA